MTFLMLLILAIAFYLYWTQTRDPDLVIGSPKDPQTKRWHLFRGFGIQVALHRWCRSDADRALHDHVADNISIIVWGSYREWFSHNWQPAHWKVRYPLVPYYRIAETPHRIELHRGAPVWSIWIRFRPRREWGFWCEKGWRHWREYVSLKRTSDTYYDEGVSEVGKGCDE